VDSLSALVLSVLWAAGATAGIWHWNRCYQRGRVYCRGWWTRNGEPFNYWFAMVGLALLVTAAFGLSAGYVWLVVTGGSGS
jgi:hypothetical protein